MRNFKWGLYATYNGEEYNAAKSGIDIILISHNHLDLNNGFERSINDENYYTKKVLLDEVSNIYEVVTYIKYKNHKFLFDGCCDGNDKIALLCTDNPNLAIELGGAKYPRGSEIYILYIKENQIEDVIEEKRYK